MSLTDATVALLTAIVEPQLEATILTNGSPAVDDTGATITLPVESGDCTEDQTAAVRWRCTLTLADPDGVYVPQTVNDLLLPYGNELALRYGLGLPDGTIYWTPVGVYGIDAPEIDEEIDDNGNERLTVKLAGLDRAASIQTRRWVNPYTIAAGTNAASAIHDLLDNRRPGLTYRLAATSHTLPVTVLGTDTSNDPWKDAQDIATAAGMLLYFDNDGTVVLQDKPDPGDLPIAWDFSEGPNCTVYSLGRQITADTTYSGIVVSGEGSGVATPVRATIWDTDKLSPTYHLGPFGERPYFYTSNLITTIPQAAHAATAMFPQVVGAVEKLAVTARANPLVRAGDVTTVARARAGLNANYMVDVHHLTFGFDGTSELTMRERRER